MSTKPWVVHFLKVILVKDFIASLGSLIKRNRRARLRRIMREYLVQKQSGHIDRIAKAKQALSSTQLGLTNEHFSPFVMGVAVGEIAVRQYLLIRLGGINLNCALLRASTDKRGSIVLPLPKQWRNILVAHGFQIAHFRSEFLWRLYVCALLLYGIVKISKTIFSGITNWVSSVATRRYVYFVDLAAGNLPQKINGSSSYDIVSWYLQWSGRMRDIQAVHHSVGNSLPIIADGIAVIPQPEILPLLTGWKALTRYIYWGMSASIIAAIDCLRGRWWHALLLNQAALAAQVRSLPVESLAREYLFHNSGWIYRPLWTYEAERLGSKITFYFYSTNCESFKQPDCYPAISFGYKAMNWPHYLVWDEYQADFVRRAVGEQTKVSVVGPIWFQSNAIEMPRPNKPSVAIFDITPHRHSRYVTLGMDSEFYTPIVTNPFLEHVCNATRQYNFDMLWKRKRNIGRIAHPVYRHLADQLSNNSHVMLVDPEISAIRVIESSVAVISMPFTSTAIIAKEMGKPSIYYDPSGLLQKDDRAAHGIAILSTRDELATWLSHQVPTHLV